MGYTKWIGAFLGYINGGTLGAIAGFILGTAIDIFTDRKSESSILTVSLLLVMT